MPLIPTNSTQSVMQPVFSEHSNAQNDFLNGFAVALPLDSTYVLVVQQTSTIAANQLVIGINCDKSFNVKIRKYFAAGSLFIDAIVPAGPFALGTYTFASTGLLETCEIYVERTDGGAAAGSVTASIMARA